MVIYVDEEGRELVTEAVLLASIVTSTATHAEARAGLGRRLREGDFAALEY